MTFGGSSRASFFEQLKESATQLVRDMADDADRLGQPVLFCVTCYGATVFTPDGSVTLCEDCDIIYPVKGYGQQSKSEAIQRPSA